ncbi:copper homeostasis protein CutC [Flavobacterium terrisoli]|uniref:copper homeostasis protein CutC n=1 Tax=Flavobacterium terrisoli TaxID=3242195 RepID=UPI002543358D|nr:copper homeostasis protein CutC [Flavobacterium buctense]
MAQLEIACFNLESALIAQENGADRIELCDDFELGGTTPLPDIVRQVRSKVTIDLFVMIRQRGGNFVYSMTELMIMHWVIQDLKEAGVDGFVFGVLTHEHKVDVWSNTSLIKAAEPLPCTFHRAFDDVENPFEALEQIIDCGFKTILTSGQEPNVTDGMNRLTELVKAANNRIVIMPGGGLRSTNIETIQQNTKAVFYHSSAITDGSQTANAQEIQALKAKLK